MKKIASILVIVFVTVTLASCTSQKGACGLADSNANQVEKTTEANS